MLDCQQIRPPAKFNPQGIGEFTIGVRILIPREAVSHAFFPDGNQIGTEIMCRLLQARMEQAGVHVTEPGFGLVLNSSFYMFIVSELAAAQEAIKKEMEKLRLLEWVQIAWRDPREDVWRDWYSKTSRFEVPSDEEFAADRALLDEITAMWRKAFPPKDEPPGP
jgi:hypothetical protein